MKKTNDNLKKHEIIKEEILSYIKAEGINPGEKLPSINELIARFRVSSTTVIRAISDLNHAGYLTKVQGKGTFLNRLEANTRPQINMLVGKLLSFVNELMRGVEQITFEKDYSLVLSNCEMSHQRIDSYLKKIFQEQTIAGLIIVPAGMPGEEESFKPVLDFGLPFVLLDKPIRGWKNVPTVLPDNTAGAGMAVKHLLEIGHKRIGFVAKEPYSQYVFDTRLNGYRQALEAAGLYDPEAVILFENENTDKLVEKLRKKEITALLALSDYDAKDIYDALKRHQIKVPQEVAIVGYDNVEMARHLAVPLTTVAQPKYEMGVAAAETLIDIIEKKAGTRQLVFQPSLEVRASSGSKAG
ncbi:MAG: GntR family transcriptional regulator [bacterium]